MQNKLLQHSIRIPQIVNMSIVNERYISVILFVKLPFPSINNCMANYRKITPPTNPPQNFLSSNK